MCKAVVLFPWISNALTLSPQSCMDLSQTHRPQCVRVCVWWCMVFCSVLTVAGQMRSVSPPLHCYPCPNTTTLRRVHVWYSRHRESTNHRVRIRCSVMLCARLLEVGCNRAQSGGAVCGSGWLIFFKQKPSLFRTFVVCRRRQKLAWSGGKLPN